MNLNIICNLQVVQESTQPPGDLKEQGKEVENAGVP